MGLVLGQFVSLLITSTAFSSSELARRGPSLACFSLFFRFGCLLFRRFVCRNAVRVGFFWVLFGSNLVKRVVDLRRRLSSFDAYFSFFWTICSSKDNKGGFFLSFLGGNLTLCDFLKFFVVVGHPLFLLPLLSTLFCFVFGRFFRKEYRYDLVCVVFWSRSLLWNAGVNAPTSQSFLNYLLLAIFYGAYVIYRRRPLQVPYSLAAFAFPLIALIGPKKTCTLASF